MADIAAVDFNVQGYEFSKRCSKSGNGGGVGAYIRNDMISNIRHDLDDTDIRRNLGGSLFKLKQIVHVGHYL